MSSNSQITTDPQIIHVPHVCDKKAEFAKIEMEFVRQEKVNHALIGALGELKGSQKLILKLLYGIIALLITHGARLVL